MPENRTIDAPTKSLEEQIGRLLSAQREQLAGPKKLKKWNWIVVTIGLIMTSIFFFTGQKIGRLEKKQKAVIYSLEHQLPINLLLPLELQNLPSASGEGIVLSVKNLPIRNVFAPYNASILKNEKEPGYHLIFRYDQFSASAFPEQFYSYIGICDLNDQFEQTPRAFKRIDTGSRHSEDPRAIKIGGDCFITYNDLQPHSPHCRSMRIAKLDLENRSLDYITNLGLHLENIEKTWTPFEYVKKGQNPILMLEYNISPHTVFSLPHPEISHLEPLIVHNHPQPALLPWPKRWGKPRGGTPPVKIGDEYLSFFHSSFEDKNDIMWFVFGAYTFDAEPPFHVTSVSKCPILFEGLYDTPIQNMAPWDKRIIYPAGFVVEEREGKELIQLICGENSSGIKIVTIDKEKLLKNMIACKNEPESSFLKGRRFIINLFRNSLRQLAVSLRKTDP